MHITHVQLYTERRSIARTREHNITPSGQVVAIPCLKKRIITRLTKISFFDKIKFRELYY